MPSSSPNPSGSITPTPLTPEREAEIGGRAAAATPGPWTVDLEQCDCSDGLCSHGTYVAAIYADGERRSEFDEIPDADWQFIAHAREDVRALFAEIDRLRRAYIFDTAELKLEIDQLREYNAWLRRSLANGEKVVTARDAQLSTFRHLAAEHLYRSTEAAADPDDLKVRSLFLNEATIAGRFHEQLERAGIDLTAELDRASTEGGAR